MDRTITNFLMDLVDLYHEKYNETIEQIAGESEGETRFRLGAQTAYYDCLDLLESQLKAFGHDVSTIGVVAPVPGVKVSRRGQV